MPRCKPWQGYEGGADADTYALESRLKVRRATLGTGGLERLREPRCDWNDGR